jgi:hypothetical protein
MGITGVNYIELDFEAPNQNMPLSLTRGSQNIQLFHRYPVLQMRSLRDYKKW